MSCHLILFDSDLSNISALASAFAGMTKVSFEHVDKMLYLQPPKGLDIFYLPLAAAERWGSQPLVHKSQILTTTQDDQRQGLPPFIVTGTCLAPNDPRGPVPETTLLLMTAFDAIRAFNNENGFTLKHIGFWAYNLLKGLTPLQLKDILIEVVPELL